MFELAHTLACSQLPAARLEQTDRQTDRLTACLSVCLSRRVRQRAGGRVGWVVRGGVGCELMGWAVYSAWVREMFAAIPPLPCSSLRTVTANVDVCSEAHKRTA